MFLASCILLCVAAAATHQHVFTYVKPWNPFRRSMTECEMCYNRDCILTREPRCEYYAEASKVVAEDEGDEKSEPETLRHDNKIDFMIFELVHTASSIPQFSGCIPFVSQYTDCTEENICIGCKLCRCSEEGRWMCKQKQKCRPEPKLNVDHRVVGIVIENLKRKEKSQERRFKRSAAMNTKPKNDKSKLTYEDISKWMYEAEPVNYEEKQIGIAEILEYLKGNGTTFNGDKNNDQVTLFTTLTGESVVTTEATTNNSDNYIDLLEFNDILQSWKTVESNTKKPYVDQYQASAKQRSEEIHINNIDYTEYDPIRLMKREISQLRTSISPTIVKTNSTYNNNTPELIITDALRGLNKITSEKQKELREIMNIQNKLLSIAHTRDIAIDTNSTVADDNYNKHHIAIYKLDTTEKHDVCRAIDDIIKTEKVSNSSDFQRVLQQIFSLVRRHIVHEYNKTIFTKGNILSSQENYQIVHSHNEPDNIYQIFNPIRHMSDILTEINNELGNPLLPLSQHVRKILKRIIKQLYLDDFAVIDFIVHETYYDFDTYLENIGTKWNKMMQDIMVSEVFDTLYRIKLLHFTLNADISKMEDMITLLDFARNRRMTVANGVTIDKSILRIQNNLQLIDNNVQKIMKLEKSKRMRQASMEKNKPKKKKSILQKLKKMFQSSKKDIKDMLRKRFPKSEIAKQIAKKKIDELEKRKMLEYQETMKQWQENLSVVPMREKRSAWGFQAFADRIKNIIPGYLRGKVKPGIKKKKAGNKTQIAKKHRNTKGRRTEATTVKASTDAQTPTES